jgi:hypothetical protein
MRQSVFLLASSIAVTHALHAMRSANDVDALSVQLRGAQIVNTPHYGASVDPDLVDSSRLDGWSAHLDGYSASDENIGADDGLRADDYTQSTTGMQDEMTGIVADHRDLLNDQDFPAAASAAASTHNGVGGTYYLFHIRQYLDFLSSIERVPLPRHVGDTGAADSPLDGVLFEFEALLDVPKVLEGQFAGGSSLVPCDAAINALKFNLARKKKVALVISAASFMPESSAADVQRNMHVLHQIAIMFNAHEHLGLPQISKLHLVENHGRKFSVMPIPGAPVDGLDLYVATNSAVTEAILHAASRMPKGGETGPLMHVFVASPEGRDAATQAVETMGLSLSAYDIRSHESHPNHQTYSEYVASHPDHPKYQEYIDFVLRETRHARHLYLVQTILQNPDLPQFQRVANDVVQMVMNDFNHQLHFPYILDVITNPQKYQTFFMPCCRFVLQNDEHMKFMRDVLGQEGDPSRNLVLQIIERLPEEVKAQVAVKVVAEGGGVIPGLEDLQAAFASPSFGFGK